MDVLGYAILMLIAGLVIYGRFAPVKGLRNLEAARFREESRGGRVVDVREPFEYRRGHIPGAVNIPLGQLRSRISEIPNDVPVFLYCHSGMRSRQAGRILLRHGYRQVAHLKGGMAAWDGPLAK